MALAESSGKLDPALVQLLQQQRKKAARANRRRPNINSSLPSELLLSALERVSMETGQYDHAVVCRQWASLAPKAQLKMKLRDNARLSPTKMLSAIMRFPALRSLRLTEGSMQFLSDSIMEELSARIPQGLKQLHIETYCSVEKPVFSSSGLSSLISRCPEIISCTLSFAEPMQLPGNFQTLSRLKLLELKNVSQLPDSLSKLSSLQQLVMLNETATSAPPVISKLTGLRKLSLNFLELEEISRDIRCLKNLRDLEIFSTQVTELPYSMFSLTKLKRLHLRCNLLEEIPDKQLQQLTGLEALEIAACSSLHTLPPSLPFLPNLTRLEAGQALSSLPGEMSEGFGNLHSLKLSFLEDGDELPRGLASLAPTLRSLSFECCGLFKSLPAEVWQLTKLERLSIDFCIELESLSEELGEMRSLTRLELSGLPKLSSLPHSIGQLDQLEELVVCSLDSLTLLPTSLFSMYSLRDAHISSCPELWVPDAWHLPQPWRGFVKAFQERSMEQTARQLALVDSCETETPDVQVKSSQCCAYNRVW